MILEHTIMQRKNADRESSKKQEVDKFEYREKHEKGT